MRKTALLMVFVLLVVPYARAVIGTMDNTPAATVLFPYFEVDVNNATGVDTQLTITNASATAMLTNIVIWTDLSVPVLRFNVYLTGYDTQRISMRDILVNGNLPQTASDGQDPTDVISPQGAYSQDINFASCSTAPTALPPANLTAAETADLRAALTGANSATLGGCAGVPHGDGIARGYVTVDTVSACATTPHTDATYSSLLTNQNTLIGDYAIVDTSTATSFADSAVHIEADPVNPLVSTAGNYTFYGRFNGFNASDRREPLGTRWAATYIRNGTHAIAWRDPKAAQSAFPCGSTIATMGQDVIVVFDPISTPDAISESEARPLPYESSRVLVGSASFPVNGKFGWIHFNLNEDTASGANPPVEPVRRQGFLTMVHRPDAFGGTPLLNFGFSAVELQNASSGTTNFPDPMDP